VSNSKCPDCNYDVYDHLHENNISAGTDFACPGCNASLRVRGQSFRIMKGVVQFTYDIEARIESPIELITNFLASE
jgi:hypothetical protein